MSHKQCKYKMSYDDLKGTCIPTCGYMQLILPCTQDKIRRKIVLKIQNRQCSAFTTIHTHSKYLFCQNILVRKKTAVERNKQSKIENHPYYVILNKRNDICRMCFSFSTKTSKY